MKRLLHALRLVTLSLLMVGSLGTAFAATSAPSAAETPSLIPANAVNVIDASCDFQTGNVHAACIPKYINYVIGLIFSLTGAFFVLMVIYAGYQIALGPLTGNKEEGKQRLTWAIGGLIMTALSFFLIDFVIQAVSS